MLDVIYVYKERKAVLANACRLARGNKILNNFNIVDGISGQVWINSAAQKNPELTYMTSRKDQRSGGVKTSIPEE